MGLLAKVKHAASRQQEDDYNWIGHELEKVFELEGQAQTEKWTKDQDWFRPSSLTYKWGSGMCARYWYYIFHKYPRFEKSEAQSVATMGHGTHRHEVLQAQFEKLAQFVENERSLSMENPTLRGSCDLVMRVNDEEIIGEIKTTKQETWYKRQLEGPPYYNVLQVALYMHMAGVKRGFIMIENNNNRQVLLFPVVYDEKLQADVERLFEWMREVESTTKETDTPATLPQRCFTKSTYNCKGCPFRKQCWEDPEGEVKLPVSPAYKEGALA